MEAAEGQVSAAVLADKATASSTCSAPEAEAVGGNRLR
jgi:hypothetical protein